MIKLENLANSTELNVAEDTATFVRVTLCWQEGARWLAGEIRIVEPDSISEPILEVYAVSGSFKSKLAPKVNVVSGVIALILNTKDVSELRYETITL